MASAKRRRAYIGNLRPRPNLADNLHADLFIPHCLSVKSYPGGDGISVRQPKFSSRDGSGRGGNNTARASSAYALVEFVDVDYAVQVLDGVQFDGRTLRVSREKTNNFGGGRGGGFGSSRWAGDDRGGGGQRRDSNKQPSKGRAGNNPSSDDVTNVPAGTDGQGSLLANWEADGLTREEAAAKEVGATVSAEIKDSSDEVTAAIACTAAMALLSSVDAFGLDGEPDAIADGAERNQPEGDKVNTNDMTNGDFQSRCKLPLADLMAEYGEQDVDWKKRQPPTEQPQDSTKSDKDLTNDDFQSRCKMPLSQLMEEYGEQDLDWKRDQKPASTQSSTDQNRTYAKPKQPHRNEQCNEMDNNGMLAPFGKAPIHVEIVSFGYKYGAPSHSKRGFTYAQPLPPLDIRDLDRAPGHVAKFNGLSYLVKRALLNPSKAKDDDDCEESETTEDTGAKEQSPMRQRANDIADEVIKMLVESIDEGGHGAISPLTMTISVGSEYGRHRSVVLVEHLAVVLRARLRRNDGRRFNETGDAVSGATNGIVQQPVSVGTRHMHVEARHQDEEAFGEDLKREFRRAEKAKRRQEREDELGWDNGSW
ncbi:hypothetical protein ACHAXT_003206 [Thalassiosira profunda]